MSLPRDQVRAFVNLHRDTLVRLMRVNTLLSQWEAVESAAATAGDMRPRLRELSVSRADLQEQQQVLVELVRNLEAGWERRN